MWFSHNTDDSRQSLFLPSLPNNWQKTSPVFFDLAEDKFGVYLRKMKWYWEGGRHPTSPSPLALTLPTGQRVNNKLSCLLFSFQTTPLRALASQLLWQTELYTESYLFWISFSCLQVFCSFFYLQYFFFNSTFSFSWCELNIKSQCWGKPLSCKSHSMECYETWDTAWQTVINSNCIIKKKKNSFQKLRKGPVSKSKKRVRTQDPRFLQSRTHWAVFSRTEKESLLLCT
jgi:hypothetical protein